MSGLKHGYTVTHKKLYHVWHAMKKRCKNPNNMNYGGRGITFCSEWEKAENFCEWALNNGYHEGLELDRIDVNGNYCPENCRWVDRKTNAQNQRRALLLTANGKTMCATEWERILGVNKGNVVGWVHKCGKEFAEKRIEEILMTGTYKKYKKNQVKNMMKGRIVT